MCGIEPLIGGRRTKRASAALCRLGPKLATEISAALSSVSPPHLTVERRDVRSGVHVTLLTRSSTWFMQLYLDPYKAACPKSPENQEA